MEQMVLAYADLPQRVSVETAAGGLRISIPVTHALRRAVWHASTTNVLRRLVPSSMILGVMIVRPLWPEHPDTLRMMSFIFSGVPLGFDIVAVLCLAWGWVDAQRLRPTTVVVNEGMVVVQRWGTTRADVWALGGRLAVEVKPFGTIGTTIGRLTITVRGQTGVVATASITELEPAVLALRVAFNQPVGSGGPPRS